jgi:hypothetical protein
MSVDEIRSQKAMALLEFREAEEQVALLEKEKATFVSELHAFATAVEKLPGKPTGDWNGDVYHRLTSEAAYNICQRLHEARKQLADARAKILQFGL